MSKNNKKSDTSPKVHQNTKIRESINIDERTLTPKQIELLELLKNKNTKCVYKCISRSTFSKSEESK